MRQQFSLTYLPFPWTEGKHYAVAENGCWGWELKLTRAGYGRVDISSVRRLTGTQYAHRAGYVALYGPLEKTIDVHHKCRNTLCVNPEHLEALDASTHRRRHQRAISSLTPADVVTIRERAWAGATRKALADEYGLNPNTVQWILKGVTWPEVGGPVGRPPTRCWYCDAELTGQRHKRYCGHTCQSAYHRKLERERVAHKCEKCHRGATYIWDGHHFCGFHCKKHWDDPRLIRLDPIYSTQRTPTGRNRRKRGVPA